MLLELSTLLLTCIPLTLAAPAPSLPLHRQRLARVQPPVLPRQANTTTTSGQTGVARAGGVLNPEAAAEANQRDDTATRAFSGAAIKSSDGQCLFVDPTAGDFRENLIPVTLKACDGSTEQQFDIITKGKHNNEAGSALVVSGAVRTRSLVDRSLEANMMTQTQGCLNFDPRRAAGDQVIMFSCGGRADGGKLISDTVHLREASS